MGSIIFRPILTAIANSEQRTNERLERLDKKVTNLVAINGLLLPTLNVYDAMSVTSAGRVTGLKNSFCQEHSYNPGTCMLTGQQGTVTLAHILPFSSQKNLTVLQLLELNAEELNSSRNLLLLTDNIEFYFDRLQLSFIPKIGEGLIKQFVLKIWDDSIRQQPIFRDSPTGPLIQEYEGVPLTFNVGHTPYSRCLAYQAMWACAKNLGGDFQHNSIPYDISSLSPKKQNLFTEMLHTQQATLNAAINEN